MSDQDLTGDPASTAQDAPSVETAEPVSPSWQDHFPNEWNELKPEYASTGFKNQGTECYRNAVFQMLAHAPIIVNWVEWYRINHLPAGQDCTLGKKNKECKICLLYDVLCTFWDDEAGDCTTAVDALWGNIFPNWKGGKLSGEQDPAEFWGELYQQLSESAKLLFRIDLRQIWRLSTVAGIQCHGKGACEIKYLPDEVDYLTVQFPQTASGNTTSMVDAIDQYFAESTIDDSDSVCKKCKNRRSTFQRLTRRPEYLLVKVNRIGKTRRGLGKLHHEIDLVDRLTLTADRFHPHPGKKWADYEYELSAVVMHHGESFNSGHYQTIVRSRGGEWILADDKDLYFIPWDKMAKDKPIRKEAYLFTYRRISMTQPTGPQKRSAGADHEGDKSIDKLKGFLSKLDTLPTNSEGVENPQATEEYQRLEKEILNHLGLNHLGAKSQVDAEKHKKLAEDVTSNVVKELGRLRDDFLEAGRKTESDDDDDDDAENGNTSRPLQDLRDSDEMRGSLNVMFTPNASEEPTFHVRMKGMLHDVLKRDDSKGLGKNGTKPKKNFLETSPPKESPPKESPPKESKRVTRGKREAGLEGQKPAPRKKARTRNK